MYKHIKRFFDFVFSLLAIAALSPLFILAAAYIKIVSKGPVFFRQTRMGFLGEPFTILKFRTMEVDENRKPSALFFEKKNEGMIKGGNLIRRLKIDELPQLFNILKGDMALIGPRPCMPTPMENFTENGKLRFNVLPGCTGLAQVNGNIYISWEDRWDWDAYYVKNLSFVLDLKIFLKTFALILVGEKRFAKK